MPQPSRVLCAAVLGTMLSTSARAQETPIEANLDDAVLGASSALRIADRVFVQGDITSAGIDKTVLGNDTVIDGSVLSLPAIDIGHRTVVDGAVRSSGPIHIARSAFVDPALIGTLSGGVFDQGGLGGVGGDARRTLTLPPDSTGTLSEAFYDSITVVSRAELTIPGGTTTIGRLTVEPGATVILDDSNGPIELFVTDAMTFSGSWELSSPSTELDLVYASSRSLLLERSFVGQVRAPFAALTLGGNGTTFVGAFFADSILVRPGVTVLLGAVEDEAPTEEKDKDKDKT